MKVCPKHDVKHGDDEKCWCCEQAEKQQSAAPAQPTTEKQKPQVVATGGK